MEQFTEIVLGWLGLTHISVFFINILLLIFARPLVSTFNEGKEVESQIKVFRGLNILFFFLHIADLILLYAYPSTENYLIRIGLSLATIYTGIFFFQVISYFSRRKFGRTKMIDTKSIFLDTYNSRVVDIFGVIFLALTCAYFLIKIWNLEGLLQTTGFIGIIFAFLALTNSIWAPDIYFGLVILNSHLLEDGDVIVLEDENDEFIINKVSFVYCSLLDIRNNHRVMVRNSKLLASKIDNLSKRASIDGVRMCLNYKIGYPDLSNVQGKKAKQEAFQEYRGNIANMFEAAEKIVKPRFRRSVHINDIERLET